MSAVSQRDDVIFTNGKLSGSWSAALFVPHIKPKLLDACLQRFEKLDPLVKVRLMIACSLLPDEDKTQLAPYLARLGEAGRTDGDEWVRAIALAVGDFRKPLSIHNIAEHFPVVEQTLQDFQHMPEESIVPAEFAPLEELYLQPNLRTVPYHPPTDNAHFRLRQRPADHYGAGFRQ